MKGFSFGWLSGLGMLVGVVGLFICGVSALGILMGWEIEFGGTEMPSDWGSLLGLLAACGLICILSFYGAFMRSKFQAAKGKPMVRIALVVIGVGLLILAGRGVQVVALTMSYGSMLAYYATDGDLEDVKGELAKGPKPEHLDAAVGRAAQYDNVEALKLLLAAGADFRDATEIEERRRCVLGSVGVEFVKVAVAHGVSPDTCPKSRELIAQRVSWGKSDEETAAVVTLLRGAGWDPRAVDPDDSKPRYAIDLARKKQWAKTIAALE